MHTKYTQYIDLLKPTSLFTFQGNIYFTREFSLSLLQKRPNHVQGKKTVFLLDCDWMMEANKASTYFLS